jgi:hypothetical protein
MRAGADLRVRAYAARMHESERNRLRKQLRLLRFAAGDMRQARAAITALLATTEEDDVNLMLALETAVVVCYARPFTEGEGVGRLDAEWAPEDDHDASVHEELLYLRDKAGAHTDKKSGRDVVERFELYDDGLTGFQESWQALDRELLRTIVIPICDRQERRFQEAAYELAEQLGRET